jgi:sec-independent protein translocase protein TatA
MKAGFWEILLIVVLVLILFGHSKIPDLMKNLASGINVFKKELKAKDEKAPGKPAAKKTSVAKKPAPAKAAKPKAKKK